MAAGKASKWCDKSMKVRAERRYWERVRDKAAELGSDGCTGGSGAFIDCCLRHDVERRLGTTIDGAPVTADDAHKRFLACMQSRSRFGWWSPAAWWRYAAVKLFDRGERGRDKAAKRK